MYIELFEEFEKKKNKKKSGETSNYAPPEYLVQPADNDKGFFMFKDAFDKKRKRFDTGFFSTTVNNDWKK